MKLTCHVCGKKLVLHPTKTYLARESATILSALTQSTYLLECTDCDFCGCQNILNKRFPKNEIIITEEKENDTDE